MMTYQLITFVLIASLSSTVATLSGTYQITNLKTRTTLENHHVGQDIFVGDGSLETDSSFSKWVITPIAKSPPNFYSLQNLGSGGFAALTSAKPGDRVTTTPHAQVFNITKINNLSYAVRPLTI
ncbi:hypothetical protein BDZ94DRAFT_793170 [Collybia nuda]|uniref:Uncharacterized protein n=1 Tax=Collybia nuda TaxID=64659 RepID=A0A9P5Y3T9_9AGAR|nr:hypothetical protein BDZ94DRAFT_793170 [Collybia nuda]